MAWHGEFSGSYTSSEQSKCRQIPVTRGVPQAAVSSPTFYAAYKGLVAAMIRKACNTGLESLDSLARASKHNLTDRIRKDLAAQPPS